MTSRTGTTSRLQKMIIPKLDVGHQLDEYLTFIKYIQLETRIIQRNIHFNTQDH